MRNEALYRPCVGICLANKTGLVFAGKRLDVSDYPWMMPQGGIERDEDVLSAARRELYEETGVTSARLLTRLDRWLYYDLPSSCKANRWGGRFVGQKQLWVLFEFYGRECEINISGVNGEEAEFSDWNWFTLDTVLTNIVPFKREVYEVVVKEFSSCLA